MKNNSQKYTAREIASAFSFLVIREALFSLSDYSITPEKQGIRGKENMAQEIINELDCCDEPEDAIDYIKRFGYEKD